jgi:Holliday junction resolvase
VVRKSRTKGVREELALLKFLQQHGFNAVKSSRAGYTGTDLTVSLLGVDRRVEVKVRADSFRKIYTWLNGADLLIIRSDRKKPLCVVPLALAAEVASLQLPTGEASSQEGKHQ